MAKRIELQNAFIKNSEICRTPYTFVKFVSVNYNGQEERVLKRSKGEIEPSNGVYIISSSICYSSGAIFIKQMLKGFSFSYLNPATTGGSI